MTELTVLDVAGFAVIGMVVAVGVLASYAWQEHEAAARQRVRAEEHWCWAELHRTEADAARKRLHVLERRHATLQTLHAENTRLLLGKNFTLIERNVRRQVWKN